VIGRATTLRKQPPMPRPRHAARPDDELWLVSQIAPECGAVMFDRLHLLLRLPLWNIALPWLPPARHWTLGGASHDEHLHRPCLPRVPRQTGRRHRRPLAPRRAKRADRRP